MIRYSLRCPDGHEFEGWFRSSQVFDTLRSSGEVTCPDCGDARIDKAPMAPAIAADHRAGRAPAQPAAPPATSGPDESGPAATGHAPPVARRSAPQIARALAELRAQVEANSDYVGMRFVHEAQAMHDGRAEPRPIHGEARIEDARRMISDGLPVMPLPFRPRRRMN